MGANRHRKCTDQPIMKKLPLFVAGAFLLHCVCTNLRAASFSLGSINPVVSQESASHFDFTFSGNWTDAQTFSAASDYFDFTLSWGEPGAPQPNGWQWVDYTFDAVSPLGSWHGAFNAPELFGTGGRHEGRVVGEETFWLHVDRLWSDDGTQTIGGAIRLETAAVPAPSALPIFLGLAALVGFGHRKFIEA
jgi:hypothetical protein